MISKLKKSISEFQTINHKFIHHLDSFSREFESYGYEDIDIESIFAVPLRHIQDSNNYFIVSYEMQISSLDDLDYELL